MLLTVTPTAAERLATILSQQAAENEGLARLFSASDESDASRTSGEAAGEPSAPAVPAAGEPSAPGIVTDAADTNAPGGEVEASPESRAPSPEWLSWKGGTR